MGAQDKVAGSITINFHENGDVDVNGAVEDGVPEIVSDLFTVWAKAIALIGNELGGLEVAQLKGIGADGQEMLVSLEQ